MPKKSEAHMEARRQQILDAAIRCFARSGVQAASMRDIGREADLSLGALYVHFRNKQELIDAAFEAGNQRIEELQAALGGDEEQAAAVMDGMVPMFFGQYDDPSRRVHHLASVALLTEAVRDEGIRALYRRQSRGMTAALATGIRALQRAEFKDVDVDSEALAVLMVCLHEGFRIQKMVDPEIDTGRVIGAMERLLFDKETS